MRRSQEFNERDAPVETGVHEKVTESLRTKTLGKGRMFYTALGDWERTWRDSRYEKHLIEGIRWTISVGKEKQ